MTGNFMNWVSSKVNKLTNFKTHQGDTEMSEETVEPQAQEAQAPDSISLNDLNLLRNIVDLASQRGAFRGNELTQVGAVYDKLNAFLSFVAEQQAAQAEENSEEVSEEIPETMEV